MRGPSMSTRRIDGPGSFGGDAIGALVAQLPGATRLSHVLTAGAKHLEEQQRRKSADVAGYARSQHDAYFAPNNDPYAYNPNVMTPSGSMVDLRVLVQRYRISMAQLIAAGRHAVEQYRVQSDLDKILHACRKAKDMDYLREQDMYVALAFIATTTDGNNVLKKMWATQLLREALHHDRDMLNQNPAYTYPNHDRDSPPQAPETERAKARRLINQARYYMDGGDVAYVNPNAPQWAAMADIELVRLDRAVRGDPSPQSAADAVAGKKTLRETYEDLDKESEAQSKKAASALEKAKAEEEEQGDLGTWSYSRNPDDSDDEREEQLPHNPRSE